MYTCVYRCVCLCVCMVCVVYLYTLRHTASEEITMTLQSADTGTCTTLKTVMFFGTSTELVFFLHFVFYFSLCSFIILYLVGFYRYSNSVCEKHRHRSLSAAAVGPYCPTGSNNPLFLLVSRFTALQVLS